MRECDLIMKGGISSGVVYPPAIKVIAKSRRFVNIGGTSAGAIAAVGAAAAEYRRRESGTGSLEGFNDVAEETKKIAAREGGLLSLFQPSPPFCLIFEEMLSISKEFTDKKNTRKPAADHQEETRGSQQAGTRAGTPETAPASTGKKKISSVLLARMLWRFALPLLFFVFLVCVHLIRADTQSIAISLGFLSAFLALSALGLYLRYRLIKKKLPEYDFGICSGLAQRPGTPALTDWIHHVICKSAGVPNDKVLTVADLNDDKYPIHLAAMTTDVSTGRPYRLPLESTDNGFDRHYFREEEFRQLFPEPVMKFLIEDARRLEAFDEHRKKKSFVELKTGDDFPILLVARMSLSFPGLLQAVPLYRLVPDPESRSDFPLQMKRCIFSDGGISSNFPIHFFDNFISCRPTYAISLTSYDPKWHGNQRVQLLSNRLKIKHKNEKLSLDETFNKWPALRVRSIESLFSFLWTAFNTAKDWQDTLQSILPGYAERIVEIRLDERREGGLNIDMNQETINRLLGFGEKAGEELIEEFNFDHHRFNRAITLLPKLYEALDDFGNKYKIEPETGFGEAGQKSFADVLDPKISKNLADSADLPLENFQCTADQIAKVAEQIRQTCDTPGKFSLEHGSLPKNISELRIVASARTTPPPADKGAVNT